jgi:hypothetical protein
VKITVDNIRQTVFIPIHSKFNCCDGRNNPVPNAPKLTNNGTVLVNLLFKRS